MTYISTTFRQYSGAVGSGECVDYVKAACGAPATSAWREGAHVRGNLSIREGTAIATFQGGRYMNYTDGRSHAAVYVRQTNEGLVVWDQWHDQSVHERVIRFKGGAGTPNNDGDAFSVIE
jgi:hypothetical protein